MALVPPFGLPLLAQAVKGATRSRLALVDSPGGTVQLELAETFRVSGRVEFVGARPWTERRTLQFVALRGAERHVLGHADVPMDGNFGAVELSAVPADSLLVRFEGGNWEAFEQDRPMPRAGESLHLDLSTRFGGELEVLVRADPDGRALPGAKASVLWREGETWQRAVAWTDDEGRAVVSGCRFASCDVRAEADGFGRRTLGGISIPSAAPVEVLLTELATIRGRCRFRGDPVADFEVLVIRPGDEEVQAWSFEDRADGSFEIQDAPTGASTLLACSAALPEGEPVSVATAPGSPVFVELVLGEPCTGVGRVVDAVTGDPIPNAFVRALAQMGERVLRRRGPDHGVEVDGSFRLDVLRRADTSISAGAPGYPTKVFTASPNGTGVLDFGEIPLPRSQPLVVRLLTSGSELLDTIWFQGEGSSTIDYELFPPNGVLRFEDITAGQYTFYTVWPDSSTLSTTRTLVAGRDWRVDIPFDGEDRLIVEVVPLAGEDLPPNLMLNIKFSGATGETFSRNVAVSSDGVTRVDRISGDEVNVEVHPISETGLVGVAYGRFAPGEERRIVVPLSACSLEVEVVDAGGVPLPGARVTLVSAHERLTWTVQKDCDKDGTVRFTGLSPQPVLIHAQHQVHGSRSHSPVELEDGAENHLRVELGDGADLKLRLVDGASSLPGTVARLYLPGSDYLIADRVANADGLVTCAKMGLGEYDVGVDHPGLWPTRGRIRFEGEGEPIPFEVRRLGALRVSVRTSEGTPIAAVPVGLRGLDPQGELLDWIERRLVPNPAQGLVTGSDGTLELGGLPRGEYVVTAQLPSGELLQAAASVPPKATGEVALLAP